MGIAFLQKAPGQSSVPAWRCSAEGGPSSSSRRSQRLRQQGRPAPREQALEQRRVLDRETPVERGLEGAEPGLQAGEAAGSEPAAAAAAGREAVEPDAIHEAAIESDYEEWKRGQVRAELNRTAEALLDIIRSGEELEAAIARHRDEIDNTMLQLLLKRIEAARQYEQQEDVVDAMVLLYRRLEAELSRQKASPALRLLDDVMNILDPGEPPLAQQAAAAAAAEDDDSNAEKAGPVAAAGARRQRAAARLRAAFGGEVAADADVLSVAARLAEGGERLAEELFGEEVDSEAFIKEVTDLLSQAVEQRVAVEEALARAEAGEGGGLDPAALAAGRRALADRAAGIALVQQALEVARGVVRELEAQRR